MIKKLFASLASAKGITMIEYIMLAVFMIVVAFFTIQSLGVKTDDSLRLALYY